jgi:hypothetical protein
MRNNEKQFMLLKLTYFKFSRSETLDRKKKGI